MKKLRVVLPRIPAYVLLLITTMAALLPFYIMLIMGTYQNEEIFTGLKLLPGTYLLENLKTILEGNVFTPYLNSIFISVISVVACTFISALVGYGLSKFKFKNKKLFKSGYFLTLYSFQCCNRLGFCADSASLRLFKYLFGSCRPWLYGSKLADKCKYRYVKHCGSIYLAVDRLSYGNLSRRPARDIKGVL